MSGTTLTPPQVAEFRRKIADATSEVRNAVFQEEVAKLSSSPNKGPLFRLCKRLQTGCQHHTNAPVARCHSSPLAWSSEAKAKLFAQEFAPSRLPSTAPNTSGRDRGEVRAARSVRRCLFRDLNEAACKDDTVIPTAFVACAIVDLKRGRAPGPDGLDAEQLQAAGPGVTELLAVLLNDQLRRGYFPFGLRKSHVCPVYKHGKPITLTSSYRPINLVSVISKVFERAVLRALLPSVEHQMSDHQFAYRKGRSADMMLVCLQETIRRETVNRGNKVLLLKVDLSRAFESLQPGPFVRKLLHEMGAPGRIARWIHSFLCGRYVRVRVRDGNHVGESRWRLCRNGAPQGTILGPALFNLDIATIIDSIIQLGGIPFVYADDLTILVPGKTDPLIQAAAQSILDGLSQALAKEGYSASSGKTTFTVFGTEPCDQHLHLSPNGAEVPYDPSPKLVGVHLDADAHARAMNNRIRNSSWALRAIRSASWGANPRSCIDLYSGLILGGIRHALGFWYHAVRSEWAAKLQVSLNIPLRVATAQPPNCRLMVLYHESGCSPLKDVALHDTIMLRERMLDAHRSLLAKDALRSSDASAWATHALSAAREFGFVSHDRRFTLKPSVGAATRLAHDKLHKLCRLFIVNTPWQFGGGLRAGDEVLEAKDASGSQIPLEVAHLGLCAPFTPVTVRCKRWHIVRCPPLDVSRQNDHMLTWHERKKLVVCWEATLLSSQDVLSAELAGQACYYTDGSHDPKTNQSGCAWVERFSNRCDSFSPGIVRSSYRSEFEAMAGALGDIAANCLGLNVAIFTDSQSVLRKISKRAHRRY